MSFFNRNYSYQRSFFLRFVVLGFPRGVIIEFQELACPRSVHI